MNLINNVVYLLVANTHTHTHTQNHIVEFMDIAVNINVTVTFSLSTLVVVICVAAGCAFYSFLLSVWVLHKYVPSFNSGRVLNYAHSHTHTYVNIVQRVTESMNICSKGCLDSSIHTLQSSARECVKSTLVFRFANFHIFIVFPDSYLTAVCFQAFHYVIC